MTQKYIELLGQHTASVSASGGKIEASNDPYVLQREVNYHLGKQILEENNNREDLIAIQNSFQTFEGHVVQTIQQALAAFQQYLGSQSEQQRAMYSDMAATAQRIPLDFEFRGFVKRNNQLLIDPSAPKRSLSNISFPNQNHASTQPLIAGTLERKSRAVIKGWSTHYFAVTPSKFLHQFKDDDDFRNDPTPELSLYLPECTIGGLSGDKFNVKGKDASKGKVGGALAMAHELSFRARTPEDASRWWTIISQAAGANNVTNDPPSPVSPVESCNVSGQQAPPQYQDQRNVAPVHTQGLPADQGVPSAGATPASAGGGNIAGAVTNPGTSGVDRKPGQY